MRQCGWCGDEGVAGEVGHVECSEPLDLQAVMALLNDLLEEAAAAVR